MDFPLPPSWNARNLTRSEASLLGLASLKDADVRRRQRRLATVGLWFLAAAFLLAAVADVLHWPVESWSVLLALPGLILVMRAWDMRHVRTTRRVLRRMCGQEPD